MVKGDLVQIINMTPMMNYGLNNLEGLNVENDYYEATGVLREHLNQIGIIIAHGTTLSFDKQSCEWFLVYIQSTMDYVFADKCELELL